jgi:2-polyprenyl-3-methyl-5-hydroxy-6-metoxy-1,4-benzoquinol methylase
MTELTGKSETLAVDPDRLTALVGQVINDLGGALAVPLAVIGDRLGLFAAMADGVPVTSEGLGEGTGLAERYVREWLLTMAASGYVTYVGGGSGPDAKRLARYRLSPEQVEAFTNPDSPAFVAGMLQGTSAQGRMMDRLADAFRTGEGIAWGEQHSDLFEGTARTFRPAYLADLVSSWVPAVTGLEERLVCGARVADVGCGFGTSTILMAETYPHSTFLGIDSHAPSIAAAGAKAAAAGVDERVTFRTENAVGLEGTYELVTFFDCVHDMPDPVRALRAARAALGPGGLVMVVEPMSWDTVDESLNPLGRMFAGDSMLGCLPSGLSAAPAYGMGNQAGPSGFFRLAEQAGFSEARLATSTGFNLVYQLAP